MLTVYSLPKVLIIEKKKKDKIIQKTMKIAHLEGICNKCGTRMRKTIEFEYYDRLNEHKSAIRCPDCKIPVSMQIMEIKEK